MKTMNENNQKQYTTPQVERVVLDNEISLALASAPTPPAAPGWESQNSPDYFNNDPFKGNMA